MVLRACGAHFYGSGSPPTQWGDQHKPNQQKNMNKSISTASWPKTTRIEDDNPPPPPPPKKTRNRTKTTVGWPSYRTALTRSTPILVLASTAAEVLGGSWWPALDAHFDDGGEVGWVANCRWYLGLLTRLDCVALVEFLDVYVSSHGAPSSHVTGASFRGQAVVFVGP